MKAKLFIAAALLLSTSAFAQKSVNSKDEQGTKISSVAKSEMEAGTKGGQVSSTASAKSRASLNRKNPTTEERRQRKAEREAARETRKQEHKEFAESRKADKADGKEPKSAEAKAEIEARKELMKENKEEQKLEHKSEIEARKELMKEKKDQAKDAREAAKAERKDSEKGLVNAEIKSKGRVEKGQSESNRPAKVKTGVKAGADAKIRRPNVGAKVQGSAGLGLGNL